MAARHTSGRVLHYCLTPSFPAEQMSHSHSTWKCSGFSCRRMDSISGYLLQLLLHLKVCKGFMTNTADKSIIGYTYKKYIHACYCLHVLALDRFSSCKLQDILVLARPLGSHCSMTAPKPSIGFVYAISRPRSFTNFGIGALIEAPKAHPSHSPYPC
jgi:hypothetical protein